MCGVVLSINAMKESSKLESVVVRDVQLSGFLSSSEAVTWIPRTVTRGELSDLVNVNRSL
jgi:hypothetical protein